MVQQAPKPSRISWNCVCRLYRGAVVVDHAVDLAGQPGDVAVAYEAVDDDDLRVPGDADVGGGLDGNLERLDLLAERGALNRAAVAEIGLDPVLAQQVRERVRRTYGVVVGKIVRLDDDRPLAVDAFEQVGVATHRGPPPRNDTPADATWQVAARRTPAAAPPPPRGRPPARSARARGARAAHPGRSTSAP